MDVSSQLILPVNDFLESGKVKDELRQRERFKKHWDSSKLIMSNELLAKKYKSKVKTRRSNTVPPEALQAAISRGASPQPPSQPRSGGGELSPRGRRSGGPSPQVPTNPDARDFPPLDINTPLRRTRSLVSPTSTRRSPSNGSIKAPRPSPPPPKVANYTLDNVMPRRAMPLELPEASPPKRAQQAWRSNEAPSISDRGDWLVMGGPETTHNVQPPPPEMKERLFQPSEKYHLGRPDWDSSVHSTDESVSKQHNQSLESFESTANATWSGEDSGEQRHLAEHEKESLQYTLMMQKVPQRRIEQILGQSLPFNEKANPTALNNPRIPRISNKNQLSQQQLNKSPSPPMGAPSYVHSTSLQHMNNRLYETEPLNQSISSPVMPHPPGSAPFASVQRDHERSPVEGSPEWRRLQRLKLKEAEKQIRQGFDTNTNSSSNRLINASESKSRFPDIVPPNKRAEQRPQLSIKDRMRLKQIRLNGRSQIKFSYAYGNNNPHSIPVTARKKRKKQLQKERRKEKERMYWAYKEVEMRHQKRAAVLIQAAWRGHLTRKLIFPWISSRWTAVIVIQKMFRGSRPRPMFKQMQLEKKQNDGATQMQKVFRGHMVRRQAANERLRARSPAMFCILEQSTVDIEMVEDLRTPAIEIQRHVRGYQARTKLRAFSIAAPPVQRAWRCHRAREELAARRQAREEKRAAATKIQSLQRQKNAKEIANSKRQQRDAATVIQKKARQRAAQDKVQVLRKERNAAVQIQSLHRGQVARKDVSQLRAQRLRELAAVLVLHGAVRQRLARNRRREKEEEREAVRRRRESAAVHIQCLLRQQSAKQTTDMLREEKRREDAFNLKVASATVIQCAFRCACARTQVAHLRRERDRRQRKQQARAQRNGAATKIQAMQRGHVTRRRIEHAKRIEKVRKKRNEAALKIQTAQRRKAAQNYVAAKRHKLKMKKERDQAATNIQKAFRGQKVRKEYLAECQRQEAIRKKEFNRFQREQAAIKIETMYRGHAARRKVEVMLKKDRLRKLRQASVVKIQCAVRQWIARQKYTALKQRKALENASATKIQCRHRQKTAYTKVQQLRQQKKETQAAIVIQSKQRQCAAKLKVAKLKKDKIENLAATHIQCAWRCWWAKHMLVLKKQAAKAELEAKRIEQANRRIQEERERIQGATRLQCARRQKSARQEVARRRRLKLELDSAITIQCSWRNHVARREVGVRRQAKLEEDSAWAIQMAYRQALARWKLNALKREKAQQELEQASALGIQCAWRQHTARRRRSEVKMERVRLAMKYTRSLNHMRDEASAVVIQTMVRGRLARNRVRRVRRMKIENEAATKINNVARQKIARRRFADAKEHKKKSDAATKIETVQRQRIARRKVAVRREEKRQDIAATKIQSIQRRRIAQKKVEVLKNVQGKHDAAVQIQCSVRQHLACKRVHALKEENRLKLWHKSATTIQSIVRMYLGKSKAYQAKIEQNLMTTTFRRQKSTDTLNERRNERIARVVKRQHSAFTIQRTYRWYRDHPSTRRQKSLDRLFLRLRDRKVGNFVNNRAARIIQKAYKDHVQYEKIKAFTQQHASKAIQKQYRQHLHNKEVQAFTEQHAVRCIQREYRQYVQGQKVNAFRQNRAARCIQRRQRLRMQDKKVGEFRCKTAATHIQRLQRQRSMERLADNFYRKKAVQCIEKHYQNYLYKKAIYDFTRNHAAKCIQKMVWEFLQAARVKRTINVLTDLYLEKVCIQMIHESKVKEFVERRSVSRIQRGFRQYADLPHMKEKRRLENLDNRKRLRDANRFRRMHAAKIIQAAYRQYADKPSVQRQRSQYRLQNRITERKVARITMLHKVRVIQRAWRRYRHSLGMLRFLSTQRLETRLQSRRLNNLVRTRCAKRIQRAAREWLDAKHAHEKIIQEFTEHHAANTIQKGYRRHLHEKAVGAFTRQHAAKAIQCGYRQHLHNKTVDELTRRHAAKTIQCGYRQHLHDKAVDELTRRHAAKAIQYGYRQHLHDKVVDKFTKQHAAKTIQQGYKKYVHHKAVKEFTREHAAKRIQITSRGRQRRQALEGSVRDFSCEKVQGWVAMALQDKSLEDSTKSLTSEVVNEWISSSVRDKSVEIFSHSCAAKKIQKHYRSYALKKESDFFQDVNSASPDDFLYFKFETEEAQVGDESSNPFARDDSTFNRKISEDFLTVGSARFTVASDGEQVEVVEFRDPQTLPLGTKVRANFLGMGYRKGKIAKINEDDSYHVLYDHGAKELFVHHSSVQVFDDEASFDFALEEAASGDEAMDFGMEGPQVGDESAPQPISADKSEEEMPKLISKTPMGPVALLSHITGGICECKVEEVLCPAPVLIPHDPIGQVSFQSHFEAHTISLHVNSISAVDMLPSYPVSPTAHQVSDACHLKPLPRVVATRPVEYKRVKDENGRIIDVSMQKVLLPADPIGPISFTTHTVANENRIQVGALSTHHITEPQDPPRQKRVMNIYGQRILVDVKEPMKSGSLLVKYMSPMKSHANLLSISQAELKDLGVENVKTANVQSKMEACRMALLRSVRPTSKGLASFVEHQTSGNSNVLGEKVLLQSEVMGANISSNVYEVSHTSRLSSVSAVPLSAKALGNMSSTAHEVSGASSLPRFSILPLSVNSVGQISSCGVHKVSHATHLSSFSAVPLSTEAFGNISSAAHKVSQASSLPRLSILPLSMESIGHVSSCNASPARVVHAGAIPNACDLLHKRVMNIYGTRYMVEIIEKPMEGSIVIKYLNPVNSFYDTLNLRPKVLKNLGLADFGSADLLPKLKACHLALLNAVKPKSEGNISSLSHTCANKVQIIVPIVDKMQQAIKSEVFGPIASVEHETCGSSLVHVSAVPLLVDSLGPISSCNFLISPTITLDAGDIPEEQPIRYKRVMSSIGRRFLVDITEAVDKQSISLRYMDPAKSRAGSMNLKAYDFEQLGLGDILATDDTEAKVDACNLILLQNQMEQMRLRWKGALKVAGSRYLLNIVENFASEREEEHLLYEYYDPIKNTRADGKVFLQDFLGMKPEQRDMLLIPKAEKIQACRTKLCEDLLIAKLTHLHTSLSQDSLSVEDKKDKYYAFRTVVDNHVAYDLSVLTSSELKEMKPVMSQVASHGDRLVMNLCDQGNEWKQMMRFVKVNETFSMDHDDTCLYVPFNPQQGLGQHVNIVSPTGDMLKISYEENENSISVEGVKYEIGEQVELFGCKCKIYAGSIVLCFQENLPVPEMNSGASLAAEPFNKFDSSISLFSIEENAVGDESMLMDGSLGSGSLFTGNNQILPPDTNVPLKNPGVEANPLSITQAKRAAEALLKTSAFHPPQWVSLPKQTSPSIKFVFVSKKQRKREMDLLGLLQQNNEGFIYVGRSSKHSTLIVKHPSISRRHACIATDCEGMLFITDLGSTHGTKVNKMTVSNQELLQLKNGDKVQFGTSPGKYVVRIEERSHSFIEDAYQSAQGSQIDHLAHENEKLRQQLQQTTNFIQRSTEKLMSLDQAIEQMPSLNESVMTAKPVYEARQDAASVVTQEVSLSDGVEEAKGADLAKTKKPDENEVSISKFMEWQVQNAAQMEARMEALEKSLMAKFRRASIKMVAVEAFKEAGEQAKSRRQSGASNM